MIKIAFLGPESSGKTTLAEMLTKKLNCSLVSEYARKYLENKPDYSVQDLKDMLIADEATGSSAHVEPATQEIYIPAQDSFVLREAYFAQLYDSNGAGSGEIDFDGSVGNVEVSNDSRYYLFILDGHQE